MTTGGLVITACDPFLSMAEGAFKHTITMVRETHNVFSFTLRCYIFLFSWDYTAIKTNKYIILL